MKLEFTNDFIKKLEKRCKSFIGKDEVFEVQGASVDFIDGIWWKIQIGWGNSHWNEEDEPFYNEEIFFEDDKYTFDFICGMIYQLIDMKENENDN